ncbi:MAG: hypothetical protein HYW49_03800 [Deltaproteobacteria bacterium]|nr:hypothetical protein [Deltaproteobacteria bacterium]
MMPAFLAWLALLAATVPMMAPGSRAGLPDEDPTVARLRKEFSEADKPTSETLRLKKTWYCNEHPAFKGSSVGVRDAEYFRFRAQGKNDVATLYKNMTLPHWRAFRILRTTDDALMGYGTLGLDPIENTTRMYFIRAARDGRLLVESTARASALTNPNADFAVAVSKASDGSATLRATTYSECRNELPVVKRDPPPQ